MNYYDDYDYNRGYGGAGGYDYSGGYGGGRGYGGDRDSYGGRHGGQALVPARGRDNRPQGKSIPEYEKNYKEAIRTADIQKELDILKATSVSITAQQEASFAPSRIPCRLFSLSHAHTSHPLCNSL